MSASTQITIPCTENTFGIPAAPDTRCLLLHLEPTPYILARALHVKADPELHADLFFIFANHSQDWGTDAEIAELPILLDGCIPRRRRFLRAAALIIRILQKRYTVAHLAGWGHWLILLAMVCCKLRGVPFSVESDTQLRRDRSGWREWLKGQIYPVLLGWPTTVLPGGSRQAELFRHYGVSDNKISVSHMTVNTRRIRELAIQSRTQITAMRASKADRLIALFVGRLVKEKGVALLLKAFESAASKNEKLNLVIIGDGPLRADVEDAARRFPGRIHYMGRQSQVGVVRWMKSSDFLVLPSEHEPWGLVVNEAVACGLPVIVSDACGCSDDLVLDQLSGLVFPTGDVRSLAGCITRLASDKELRRRMSSEGRRIIKPWVIERQAEAIRSALVKMSHLGTDTKMNPFAMNEVRSTNS